MHEFLIYLGISFFSIALFAFWYARQGKVSERKWLMTQLANTDEASQSKYLQRLKQLEQHTFSVGKVSLLVTLLVIPTSFIIDYLWFHEIPIEQRTSAAEAQKIPDLATAIKQLEQKLVENPDDIQGQILYGQTMMSTRDYPKAVAAYKKANELEPNNANLLTELAEAIAFKNNTGSFLGEPEQYLTQAMQIDPKNQKAMWLQGIVYYEKQQFQLAEDMWTELLSMVDNPNIKSTISKQINMARNAMNKPPIETLQNAAATPLYTIVVDVDESVKAMNFSENARLFIFAKQVSGSPMPIAAVPVQAPFEWPISVNIGDQHSLNPQLKLSQFEQVEISAKLSLTGDASANDDLSATPVVVTNNTQNIELTLTTQ
jgi:cytochrome c-type biogenesis protein CcmH